MLRSNLSNYGDACIFVKGRIIVEDNVLNNREDKKSTFKNNALFRSCISKIDNTFIDNAEDLDIVFPIYSW